jgi:hypothetical protein
MVKGNAEEEDIKRYMYNKIREYKANISMCKKRISAIDRQIIQACVIQHGEHKFELEVESSLYGESYHTCKNCGYER